MRPLLFALLLALAAPAALAQTPADTSDVRRIVLDDGEVYVGTVVSRGADVTVIRQRNGVQITLRTDAIAEITPLIGGRFFRLDPNRSRLFLSPTGRTLGAGNGRVSTFLYLLPNLAYGVTDRVDLSGYAFITGVGSDVAGVIGGNVKVGVVRTEGVAASLGASAFVPVGEDISGSFGGTVYANATLGSEVSAFTVSATGGYGVEAGDGDFEFGDGVVLGAAYERQINNGVKLILEGYAPITDGATAVALFPGVRLFGDQFVVDVYGVVGFATDDIGSDAIYFLPLANFAYNF